MSDGIRLLNEIGQKAYNQPLCAIRSETDWPTLSNPLHVVLLILDFDVEVNINGLLGFLENTGGQWLDETAAAFQAIGADSTAELLARTRARMVEAGVTFAVLREPSLRGKQYEISSFSERHGSRLDDFADAIQFIGDGLYVNDSDQIPLRLLESFVEQHANTIQSELARRTAFDIG